MTMAILTGISEHYSGDGLNRAWDLVAIITPGGHKSDLWWPDSAHLISAATFRKRYESSALYFSGLRQRGLYGIDYSLKENLTVKDFMYRERTVVNKGRSMIEQIVRHDNITLLHGEGSLRDAQTVRIKSGVTETEISGDVILIATGSSPHHPPEIPFDGKLIFDSDTILNMQQIPKTMVVIGGGVSWHGIRLDLYRAGNPCHPDRAAWTDCFLCRFGDWRTPDRPA